MIKRIIGIIFCLTLLASKNKNECYIFFLHNKFIEEHDLGAAHPKFGVAEYSKIISAFENKGCMVVSEKRNENTDIKAYALKVTHQIDSLLEKGIEPEKITVVGTSKGGYIAQYVSTFSKNPHLNFVLIGSSFAGDTEQFSDINLCGNILSITEKSDRGSVSFKDRIKMSSCEISNFKEIELNTGKEHGFLFALMDEWFQPTIKWAKGNYK